jgi:hypothetical protein
VSGEKKRGKQKDKAVNLPFDSQNDETGGDEHDAEVNLKAVDEGQKPEVRDIA